MGTIWEDIKKTFKEGVNVADEYRKIGKIKIDIMNLNRNMDKHYIELGKNIYGQIKDGKKTSLTVSVSMKNVATKISDIQKTIDKKKKEIEQIKKETEAKSRKKAAKTASDQPKEPKAQPSKPISKKTVSPKTISSNTASKSKGQPKS